MEARHTRTILYLFVCIPLLSSSILARELCPRCDPSITPLSGHGIASDGTERRKIVIYIDGSWDVSPGNTHPSIWNGVNHAILSWNAEPTCYYFEINTSSISLIDPAG